jgi:hypothetical protein
VRGGRGSGEDEQSEEGAHAVVIPGSARCKRSRYARRVRFAKALAFGGWVLVIAWLVLLVTDRGEAAGWCLFLAGLLLMVAGPIFQRTGDGQLRITGVIMAAAGLFFVLLGLFYAF